MTQPHLTQSFRPMSGDTTSSSRRPSSMPSWVPRPSVRRRRTTSRSSSATSRRSFSTWTPRLDRLVRPSCLLVLDSRWRTSRRRHGHSPEVGGCVSRLLGRSSLNPICSCLMSRLTCWISTPFVNSCLFDLRCEFELTFECLPQIAWLEDYLQTWDKTLLVVSHDRSFLDAVATDIIWQHSERLDYFKGNFSQFYATKTERARTQQKEYDTQLAYRQHLQAYIDRWRYNANRAPQAQSKIKILEKLPELEPPEAEDVETFR